jgi:hypothetical protein
MFGQWTCRLEEAQQRGVIRLPGSGTHDGHAEKHSATLTSSLLGGTVLDLAQMLA